MMPCRPLELTLWANDSEVDVHPDDNSAIMGRCHQDPARAYKGVVDQAATPNLVQHETFQRADEKLSLLAVSLRQPCCLISSSWNVPGFM